MKDAVNEGKNEAREGNAAKIGAIVNAVLEGKIESSAEDSAEEEEETEMIEHVVYICNLTHLYNSITACTIISIHYCIASTWHYSIKA